MKERILILKALLIQALQTWGYTYYRWYRYSQFDGIIWDVCRDVRLTRVATVDDASATAAGPGTEGCQGTPAVHTVHKTCQGGTSEQVYKVVHVRRHPRARAVLGRRSS